MDRRMSHIINGALKYFNSRYELVRVASIRANAILKNDNTMLSESEANGHKATIIALLEIKKGLWKIK